MLKLHALSNWMLLLLLLLLRSSDDDDERCDTSHCFSHIFLRTRKGYNSITLMMPTKATLQRIEICKQLCRSLSCLRREASNTDASSSRITAFAQHIANRRVLTTDLDDAQRIISMNSQLRKRFSNYKEKAIPERAWNKLFDDYSIPQKEAI